jgi:hypothetical protein
VNTDKPRRGIIPEPVYFPPPARGRSTQNSTRGRSRADSASSSQLETINTENQNQREDDGLPFPSGLSSPSLDNPEENPDPTTQGISNLPASQETIPVPTAVQRNPVTSTLVQTPPVQLVVLNPVSNPSIAIPPVVTSTMDKTKLPNKFGRNQLKFKGDDDGVELQDYLDTIEDVADRVGATTDEDKKWIALHYCDSRTKEQWKVLASSEPPYTWEQFKEEIRDNYPELKELEKGSLSGLERFVKRTSKKPIRANDIEGLHAYVRQYKALVAKLMQNGMRITNREAIKYFFIGVADRLKDKVRDLMRVTPKEGFASYKKEKAEWEADKANAGLIFNPPTREDDDKYVWTDILDAAVKIVEEESSSFYDADLSWVEPRKATVLLQNTEPEEAERVKRLTDKVQKLEESRLKESGEFQEKIYKEIQTRMGEAFATHLDKFTADQHKELQQIRMAVESSRPSAAGPSTYQSNPPNFVRERRGNSSNCFYCWEAGHFFDACRAREEDLNKGIIKVVNGKTCLYDGKTIPREPPNIKPRVKAQEYYARRTVSQNLVLNYDDMFDQYFGTETGDAMDVPPPDLMARISQLESLIQTRARGPAEQTGLDFH